MDNIFSHIANHLDQEIVTNLLQKNNLRIERIVSHGQIAPLDGSWYDQAENEWVLLLEGEARLAFENQAEITLHKGDFLEIPAHQKHRVTWTTPKQATLWLAIFYTD